MNPVTRDRLLLRLCRLLVCAVFLGRAWQLLRWDAPVRALLWNQKLMEPLVSGMFGIPWRSWVGDLGYDTAIQCGVRLAGAGFLLCAVAALRVKPDSVLLRRVLIAGSAGLLLLSGLYFMEQYYRVGQLLEYSLQWSAPLFLLAALRGGLQRPMFVHLLKLAVALTFIGHGLYAMGYYPVPGKFVTMLMNGTGLGENAARLVLAGAGYADFLAAVLLFVPGPHRVAVAYTVFWGFATAAARLVAYVDTTAVLSWLDGWAYQSIYRLVHGGMPLLLWHLTGTRPAAAPHPRPTPIATTPALTQPS